jgi:hypothetical protein
MISLGMYLGRQIARGWTFAKQHPATSLLLAMLLHSLAALAVIFALTTDRNNLRAQLASQQAEYTAAQAAAATKAEAARIKTEAASAASARKADREEKPDVAGQRLAADRYATARRVQPAAPCRASGSAATIAQAVAAPTGDGPGPDAVVIPRAHFDQLRDNTLRLERVRQWGESEIEAGRAVKVGD